MLSPPNQNPQRQIDNVLAVDDGLIDFILLLISR
jgi:hypothetical protein